MPQFDWKEKYKSKITTAEEAMKLVKSGDHIFIGTACAQPQHLVEALVEHSAHIYDAHIVHMLTMGAAPYATEKFREKFKMNSFFIADNVRDALGKGIGDYTPIFLSEIPGEFESGRIPLDVALITVTPPDVNGLCSLGVSVDIVKAAAANAKYVIAQVNSCMPRTFGDSFVNVNSIDCLVPFDEEIFEIAIPETDDVMRRIGENIARLVEDGSTIECGIGRIPQTLAEYLKDKKDLGIHTEMFSDWIIDLIECGAITCAKKNINHGKVVASFCMGTKRLYDYINNNPFFEFYPTEYVNDSYLISQHEKMIAINVGLEIDLTGQVCSDSLGYRFYSGIGGQIDFIRGAAKSRGGKAIIAMPSTALSGKVSRIVPHLTEGAGVVTTRGDVHYVVTEYGIAYLHGKNMRERAMELIGIAHPKFRPWLIEEAKKLNLIYGDQAFMPGKSGEYPERMETYRTTKDGLNIFIRPIKISDEPLLKDFVYSLSDQSMYRRFMSVRKDMPHERLQDLIIIDYTREVAILVFTTHDEKKELILGVGRYYIDPGMHTAEVAFAVRDDYQKRGIGTELLAYLTYLAKREGLLGFMAEVLAENRPMLHTFEKGGFDIKKTTVAGLCELKMTFKV